MDEHKLLELQIKSIERNIFKILSDMNNRINKLEDELRCRQDLKKEK